MVQIHSLTVVVVVVVEVVVDEVVGASILMETPSMWLTVDAESSPDTRCG
jgi:hypothetical protein